MLRSMTGYGGSERTDGGRRVRVEIRSVNQRFLDLQVKAPRAVLPIEDRIRRAVESRLARGRVTVFIDWKDDATSAGLSVDRAVVAKLVEDLRGVAADLGIPGEVNLSILSRFPQVFDQADELPDAENLWRSLEPALDAALTELVAMREAEGDKLRDEIALRIGEIEKIVNRMEESAPLVTAALRERLSERIRAFADGAPPVDEARLAQEVAIAAERADYTEEIVRMKAHIDQARLCLDRSEPVGKRLNFLAQEMHREANTIGSKTTDVDVSGAVVSLKEEIEKLREQVQNVE